MVNCMDLWTRYAYHRPLVEFAAYRRDMIFRIEQKQKEEQKQVEEEKRIQSAITWEEYQKRKKRPKMNFNRLYSFVCTICLGSKTNL